MTKNSYTLTLDLDYDTLQCMTKFHELLTNANKYENGEETLESITELLNALKHAEKVKLDLSGLVRVGYGSESRY